MANNIQSKLFEQFFFIGTRRRSWVIFGVAVFVVLASALTLRLEVSTSRYALVAEDNPYQSRLFEFFERFGHPDVPLLVVHGTTPERRRHAIDVLKKNLEKDEAFAGRVMAKVDALEMAELALVYRPQLLNQFRQSLAKKNSIAEIIENGFEGMLGALNEQLKASIEGGTNAGAQDIDEGMRSLSKLARALSGSLSGQAAEKSLASLMSEASSRDPSRVELERSQGLDEKGYLVGASDQHHLLVVFAEIEHAEAEELEVLVTAIRKARDDTLHELQDDDIKIWVSGLPALVVDEQEVVRRGIALSGTATSLGIFSLLWFSFRSLRLAIVALLPLGVGTIVSMGMLELLYGELNTVTSCFLALLMGLAIDFSVHLLVRYRESLAKGDVWTKALRISILKAGPGIFVGMTTTALAFLTIVSAEFTAYAQLGVMTCVGMVVTYLVTMFVLPMLLSFSFFRTTVSQRDGSPIAALDWVAKFVGRRSRLIVVVAVSIAGFGLVRTNELHFNSRYFDFLPQELESTQALLMLERDGEMSPLFAAASAPDIESARKLASELRELDAVGKVQSISDALPKIDADVLDAIKKGFAGVGREPNFKIASEKEIDSKRLQARVGALVDLLDEIAFSLDSSGKSDASVRDAIKTLEDLRQNLGHADQAHLDSLQQFQRQLCKLLERAWTSGRSIVENRGYVVDQLPPLLKTRYVAKDGSNSLALFIFPAKSIWEAEFAQTFAKQVESVDPNACGHAMSMHYHNHMIVHDFTRAAIYALALVILLVYADFRSWIDTGLALSPVVFGWCWMVLAMTSLEMNINAANVVVLPLLFGIGIDAGVHMVHRLRQSSVEHGNQAGLRDMIGGTGAAVLLSSMTTMIGFSGLMLADYGGMVSLGASMVLGLFCCLIVSLLVLPSIAVWVGRATHRDGH